MRRAVGACALALASTLLVAGCSAPGLGSKGSDKDSPASREQVINVSVDNVAGRLDPDTQSAVAAAAMSLIDSYFKAAFLGDFPRTDFGAAFADFTDGARALALEDVNELTLAGLAEDITKSVATDRTISLDVLAPKNEPAGITARWTITLKTSGDTSSTQEISGIFDLTPVGSGWQVFGYDILKAPVVPLTDAATTGATS